MEKDERGGQFLRLFEESLDKMASRSEAAHLQWGRRLHTRGVPSYTDEPER